MDHDYRAAARSRGLTIDKESGDDMNKFPIEAARVRSIWYAIAIVILATIGFGWSVQTKVHLSVPLLMSFICGIANNGVFNNCITLMVDIHPDEPGLASVATSLARCAVAAAGLAVLQPLLDSIGTGWTFTSFALICLISMPMLLVVKLKGPAWRGVDQL
ncbi:hypothetical protein BJ170DRAFT_118365 [Xylariales sp. AK1849]|nr:hypothetical protein BJ170DRAFT_118365 [Xylariales sp. AK1849]